MESLFAGRPSRRHVLATTGAGAALSLLAACGGATQQAREGAPAAAPKPATLSFFTSTSPENLDFTRPAVAAFMEEHPTIKVELEQDNKDYPTKLQTRIAGGTPPDVPFGNNLLWQRLGFAKDSRDLNPYLAKDGKVKKDAYYPNMLTPVTVDGRLAGVPGTSTISLVYYNKQHLDQLGLKYPTAKWDDPAWTMDSFLALAQKLTKRGSGNVAERWGWMDGYTSDTLWPRVTGGEWWDRDVNPTKSAINSPEAIAGLAFYQDLQQRHRVMPDPKELTESGIANSDDAFRAGRAGMVPGHYKNLTSLFRTITDFSFGVAPFPKGKRVAEVFATSSFGITSLSKEPDASWLFVRYMTALRGAEINCAGPGFPCVKTIDLLKISQAKDKDALKTIQDGIQYAKDYVVQAAVADQAASVISREMGLLRRGDKPAREVANTIATETTALLPKS